MDNDDNKIMKIGLIGVASLLVLTLLIGSWFTVPEGFRGVVLRNNAVVAIAEPGLGFKVPLISAVIDMSVQTERLDVDKVASYSKDVQQSESSVAVNYKLNPDAIREVYSGLGLAYADKVLEPSVMRRFKETFGQYTAAEVVMKRDQLAVQITELVKSDMKQFGITVEAVQVRNIDFSNSYEKSIEAAASAEADVKKERQLLESSRVSAQKQVVEAEAQATAIKATADANAYKTRAEGEAQAAAIKARGDALRDNPGLVQLIAAEKWNGALPTHQIPGASVPFISLTR